MANPNRSLTTYSPYTMSSFLDDFFDSSMERFFNNQLSGSSGRSGQTGRHSSPAINIRETEDAYQLEVAAPGLKKEHFNIDIEDNTLVISAEQQDESEDKQDNYHRREFSYSSFRRSFSLPDNVSDEDISAKYENGLLCVELPKQTPEQEEAKKRKIDIS